MGRVIESLAPELVTLGLLILALAIAFVPLPRRRPAGQHLAPARPLVPLPWRRGRQLRPTTIRVAELVDRGLADWLLAAGVLMADAEHGTWCKRCVDEQPWARELLAQRYAPDVQLVVIFGIDASVLAARMCDFPGHVRGAVA